MANNEEQNIVDKANEVKKATEETAKLAANISSGNFIGAAKNALNLLKNKQFRKALKRKIIISVLQSIIPIIIALCFFSLLISVKDKLIDILSDTGSAIATFFSKTWKWLNDDYWIDLDEETEYVINEETGETKSCTIVDQYIYELDKLGISLEDLRLLGEADYSDEEGLLEDEENKALVEKYISEFIRADIITQQPHKRSGAELVNPLNQNEVDGGVYFYRTKKEPIVDEDAFENGDYNEEDISVTDKDFVQMDYIDYDKFKEKLSANDSSLRYKFTIDPDTGDLLMVKITTVVETTGTYEEGEALLYKLHNWIQENASKTTEYTLEEVRIPYKDYISKYTMPYEFLINLCTITQNPEFVYHVALLARDTKIILVAQDNTTITREIETIETNWKDYKNDDDNSTSGASSTDGKTERTRKVTTTTIQTPVLKIEYADTWSFYEEFEYTKNVTGTLTQTGPKSKDLEIPGTLSNYFEKEVIVEDATGNGKHTEVQKYWYDSFPVKETTTTQVITSTTTYNESIQQGDSIEKSKQFLGLLRNSTGKCEYDCFPNGILENIVDEATEDLTPIALYCSKHAEFDRNGINVQYRIPNTTKTESPLNKLLSGLDMLYATLQSNSSGYREEDKLLSDEDTAQSYEKQQEYIADEDYESAYVVKMQGLVDHLRYLMTFPENESYTIKDLILDILPWLEDDENYGDIIVSEGTTASAREIYEFLLEKGMTEESACAILGNIQQESSFRTNATNGTHYGLCQWGDGRWEGLKEFAKQKGTTWTDLDTQLEYLWYELCGSKINVKNAIMNSTDMEDATDIFCRKFEVCGNYGIEVPKRYRYAKYWYNLFVAGSYDSDLTASQNTLLNILNNLNSYTGINNKDGYCQAFVRTVFEKLGISDSAASASDAERKWKVSTSMNNIPVGATVYGKGSSADGHVGIYIGNGMVVHNIGNSHNCSYGGLAGIKCEDINSWNSKYTFTSWGWQAGVDLTT